jgi:hypothetical protein
MGSAALLGTLLFVASLITWAAYVFRVRTNRSRMLLHVKKLLASDEQVQARTILDGLVETGQQPSSPEELAAASTVFRTFSVLGQKANVGIVSVADLDRPWSAVVTRYWAHFAPWVEQKRATHRGFYEHFEWLHGQFQRRQAQRDSRRKHAPGPAKSASANLS